MKACVLQVKPVLCLSGSDFKQAIDEIVTSVCDEHSPDLILFPEAMGLWMCLMRPTSWWNNLLSMALPSQVSCGGKAASFTERCEWPPEHQYEIMTDLQFAKLNTSSIKTHKRKGFFDTISRIADWVFGHFPFIRFMAKMMRSSEQFSVYEKAFSEVAMKHRVTIQAGSIFKVDGDGVRNVAYVFGPTGDIIAKQEKMHPISFETMIGILPGDSIETFCVDGIKCGIAICYDVNFSDDHVDKLAELGCDFICCPSGGIVPSHLWEWDFDRDIKQVHWARSQESGVTIGRSYSAGDLINGVLMFQGISSVTAPVEDTADESGIIAITPKSHLVKPYVLVCDV